MGLVADEEAGVASLAAKADSEVRLGETVSRPGPTESDKLDDMPHGRPAGQALRASWAAGSGSMRVGWSGKAMTMTESKKFFEVLTSATEEHVAEKLLVALPNQFVMLSEREMSTLRSSGSRAVLEVDEAVLLQELLAAENEEAEAEEDDVAVGSGVAMSGVDAMQAVTSVTDGDVSESLSFDVAIMAVADVIGIQFSGMTTGWNGGVTEGLGELLLSNILVGTMYLLLSMCYAELTSVVAFAGGSFGYCRAALGPFWGFLVGASEMLENFLYVVVTVTTIGSACTEVFGTSRQWEPVWYLVTYGLLVGVHLRGGELLWYTVMVCGSATVLSVSLFCAGEMKFVNVTKWGVVDGKVFNGTPRHFMQALIFLTWFYIGVEIMPQLCERVKDVNVNLPR
eukprot:gene23346-biopygen8088